MKHLVLIAAVTCSVALPSFAEDKDEGASLMEEGAKLFFEGIMREMGPAMEDLRGLAEGMEPAIRDFAREMGPAFADILGQIEGWNAYHPPEILPNGDIILRKKTPKEQAEEPETEGEIEI